MKKKKKSTNPHIGSSFEDFLKEEGMLEEIDAAIVKEKLAKEFEQAMKKKNITQTEMAHRLKTSRAAVQRLLDPENQSLTLLSLFKAAYALGKEVEINLIDIKK